MKRFKSCLVTLCYGENYESADDLVAGYLCAALRAGGHVAIMQDIRSESEAADLEALSAEAADLYVFTIPTTANVAELMRFSQHIKQAFPACKVALCGWDHHSAPLDIFTIMKECTAIDIMIEGEGESTICELVENLQANRTLADCLGIIFRRGASLIENPPRSLILDLDSLPFPVRNIDSSQRTPSLRISTARGCLGQCSFCPAPLARRAGEPVWRGRSPANVVSELRELKTNYGTSHFLFIDPTFEDPGPKGKARIRELADAILSEKLDVQFLVNMRAENWDDTDQELMQLLFLAGLESVSVGIEAGTETGLRLFNKRARLEDFRNFFGLLSRFPIYPAYGFIMFHPYMTLADLKANSSFLAELGLSYMLGAYLVRLKAFPGTALYQRIQQDGLLEDTGTGENPLYAYRYTDPQIRDLAFRMNELKDLLDENPHLHYANIQKFVTFTSRLRRKIQSDIRHESLLPRLAPLEKALKKMLSNLNQANHLWFCKCLELHRAESFESLWKDQAHYIENQFSIMRDAQFKYGLPLWKALQA